jgi:indolepyruvate ferredoxin oxidoreductase beta subunit
MGGEGGGVLMNWIVKAAWAKGFPVQATSVPGVAQRTGATTYYIEMLPKRLTPASSKPNFALIPTSGEVDLLIATEAAEAARAVGNGYITPDRTHLIASTARAYLMPEKMAMADGRIDDKRLHTILNKSAHKCVLFDANKAARDAGAIVNSVMLGAIAASNLIGVELEDFKQAIELEGKAVESNISGLNKGFEIAKGGGEHLRDTIKNKLSLQNISDKRFPDSIQPILQHAINRLTDYQNKDYFEIYLSRLQKFKEGDINLLEIVAKQLALRMSYEDIIRVAQVKIRSERFERIKNEAHTSSDDIVVITDFFKPGIAEISDMLPVSLGKKLISWGRMHKKIDNFGFDIEVKTTSVSGFFRLWILAKLKWWRPRSFRWKVEQANIDDWLSMVNSASLINKEFAFEVAELSSLIKGYGSTHRRGTANFHYIVDKFVNPILKADKFPKNATRKLRLARDTANKDPDSSNLSNNFSSKLLDSVVTE